jgi:2-C-methyl-D-erythritol 4-phosphate cytidylyltransferase
MRDAQYTLLLLAGGQGRRIGGSQPKQFIELRGFPMILHTLLAIRTIDEITEVVVNYPPNARAELDRVIVVSGLKRAFRFTEAGRTRQDSVRRMLPLVSNEHVIIHEAARPMVSPATFEMLIDYPRVNAGYMLEVPFTVAPVDPETRRVVGALNRTKLRNVQLPQKFKVSELRQAHAHAEREGLNFTEDACLTVDAGFSFYFLDGEPRNIKITTLEDLVTAGLLLDRTREGTP